MFRLATPNGTLTVSSEAGVPVDAFLRGFCPVLAIVLR